MKKECPYCGAKFDRATLNLLGTFDGSLITGGSVTCVSCGRTMALNEVAGIHHTEFRDYGRRKKWWQFWKR